MVRLAIILTSFCLCVLFLPAGAIPAAAAGATVTLGDGPLQVSVGQTVPLVVAISGAENVYGFELLLRFDPDVIEVLDADPATNGIQAGHGDFLALDFLVRNTADNQAGTVEYVLTQLNPSQPKSGAGTLLTVYFTGKAVGRSTKVTAAKFRLASRAGEPLPASVSPGEVRVVSAATPETSPTPLPTLARPILDQGSLTLTPVPSSAPTAPRTSTPSSTVTSAPTVTQGPSPTATTTPVLVAPQQTEPVATPAPSPTTLALVAPQQTEPVATPAPFRTTPVPVASQQTESAATSAPSPILGPQSDAPLPDRRTPADTWTPPPGPSATVTAAGARPTEVQSGAVRPILPGGAPDRDGTSGELSSLPQAGRGLLMGALALLSVALVGAIVLTARGLRNRRTGRSGPGRGGE